MKYIESLREGEKVNEVYLCKFKQAALTKAGKAYDNVILQDKTGTIDAKIWDPGSVGIDEFDALDYVAVTGDVTSFQGNLQMSIRRARRVSEEDIDPKEYLPCTDKDVEEMYAELTGYIDSVSCCTDFSTIKHLRTGLNFIRQQRVYIMDLSGGCWNIPSA